jgi:hypothetical protein
MPGEEREHSDRGDGTSRTLMESCVYSYQQGLCLDMEAEVGRLTRRRRQDQHGLHSLNWPHRKVFSTTRD